MNALKRMTGTENFLELPDKKKNCIVHKREDCQSKVYLEQVKKCGCRLWALEDGQHKHQVKCQKTEIFQCISKVSAYCGQSEGKCVSNQSVKHENCLIPSSGLYANVRDTNQIAGAPIA